MQAAKAVQVQDVFVQAVKAVQVQAGVLDDFVHQANELKSNSEDIKDAEECFIGDGPYRIGDGRGGRRLACEARACEDDCFYGAEVAEEVTAEVLGKAEAGAFDALSGAVQSGRVPTKQDAVAALARRRRWDPPRGGEDAVQRMTDEAGRTTTDGDGLARREGMSNLRSRTTEFEGDGEVGHAVLSILQPQAEEPPRGVEAAVQRSGDPAQHGVAAFRAGFAVDAAVKQREPPAPKANAASAAGAQGAHLEKELTLKDWSFGFVGSAGPAGAARASFPCDGDGVAARGRPSILSVVLLKEWGRVRQAASRLHSSVFSSLLQVQSG